MPLWAKYGGRVGVPLKIGRLTIYGGELTGMFRCSSIYAHTAFLQNFTAIV